MKTEYIIRDEMIEQTKARVVLGAPKFNAGLEAAIEVATNIPAADVVAVRHANWIEDGYYNEPYVCSDCGEPCKDTVMGKPRWHYCPNCGAKMDGGQDDV